MEENSLENTDNAEQASNSLEGVEGTGKIVEKAPESKKGPLLKRIMHRLNIYLLLFILLLVVAAVIAAVVYFSSKKAANNTVQNQTLSQDALQQLASSDVTVGDSKQTLNVQSNAVFAGKVLVRESLDVAGNIQVGGAMTMPGLTVSGKSTFEDLQVNKSLNVALDTSVQGQMTVQKSLSVNGSGTFSGPISAPAISTSSLQLNGNLSLTKHLAAGGATPSRSNGDALGSGGTAAVSGSDMAGNINVNTGGSAIAGCFATITFSQKYNSTPRVIVTPVGVSAANVGFYITRSTSSFSVCAANTPPSNASFGFDYFVIE